MVATDRYDGRNDDFAQPPAKRRQREYDSPAVDSRPESSRYDQRDNIGLSRRRSRSRSRSPDATRHKSRHRSSHERRDRHHRRDRRTSPRAIPVQLPYDARPLSKSELDMFRPLLARYLDVQKNKDMADMDEREVRGRWKSFVAKWNEGTLAGSWYDPELFEETRKSELWSGFSHPSRQTGEAVNGTALSLSAAAQNLDDREQGGKPEQPDFDEDDDDYGPVLPGNILHGERNNARLGPGVPSLQDLEIQRETNEEDRLDRIAQLRQDRKTDRLQQKEQLSELVPRAEAGTRERKLEKKKEVNEKMKGFRERSPGAAEVNDGELLGGGDSFEELKRMKASVERRKTEKEIRREEIARAKDAEREGRLKEYRQKEDTAMVMLKELAKQRFG